MELRGAGGVNNFILGFAMASHRLRTLVSILNLNGYRCCHIYNLMHDVKTAMLHYLEISTEICVVL